MSKLSLPSLPYPTPPSPRPRLSTQSSSGGICHHYALILAAPIFLPLEEGFFFSSTFFFAQTSENLVVGAKALQRMLSALYWRPGACGYHQAIEHQFDEINARYPSPTQPYLQSLHSDRRREDIHASHLGSTPSLI